MTQSTTTNVPRLKPHTGPHGIVVRVRCAVDGTVSDFEDDGHRPGHPETPNPRRRALIRLLGQRASTANMARDVGIDEKAFSFALWTDGDDVPAPAGCRSFDDAHPGLLRQWGATEEATLARFVDATNGRRERASYSHPGVMNALVSRAPAFTIAPASQSAPLDALAVEVGDPNGKRGPKARRPV